MNKIWYDFKMEKNIIYNENCFDTLKRMESECVDLVLTSPPYNTNKPYRLGKNMENSPVKAGQYHYLRYDGYSDSMTNPEYYNFTEKLFNEFDRILVKNGVVLYNISYGSENTDCMFMTIARIIEKTPFTIADCIVWKKNSAMPNNASPNKLTRIVEFVFVFCRKNELKTFTTNKKLVSVRESGQKMYENIFNFIVAKNNDQPCPYNKATYSSELCEKLLNMYAKPHSLVYDPFMGSGTTAVACKKLGHNYIGSELSEKQVKWANDRIENTLKPLDLEWS